MSLRGIATGIGLILFCSFCLFRPPDAHAQKSAEQFISDGEDALFSGTLQGIRDAYAEFAAAQSTYPNDPVINAYLALTRILDLGLKQDITGFTGLLAEYGITRTGNDLDTLDFKPTMVDDEYMIVPESAPEGEVVRSFFSDTLSAALDDSIDNLDTTILQWTDADKHIIAKENLERELNLEVDLGDIYLLRAALKAAKAAALFLSAYDLDVDVREMVALMNIDVFNPQDTLDRYPDFLKILPTATTPTGEGILQLAEARTTLISAIDDYLTASDKIRGEPDPEAGAEEFIALEPCDLQEEEFFRERLAALRDSLDDGTVFQWVDEEETWIFTDVATGNEIEIEFIDNMSEGEFWGDDVNFISGNGGVDCVVISGNQITLHLVSNGYYWADVTFSGTLSGGGTQISGSYDGWSWQGSVFGTFTAERTNVEQEPVPMNLNPLFGNGPGPYDLRDLFPRFDCAGEPVYGTLGYGLNPQNPDATLGGILPGFSQEDFEFDGSPDSGEILLSEASINVQDGSVADWGALSPVFEDVTGDGDPDLSGSDFQDLYLATYDQFLYGRITLADGPPNTDFVPDPWQAMGYFVQFQTQAGESLGSQFIQVEYAGSGTWRVQTWEVLSDGQTGSYVAYDSGYAQATGNDLEFKVPLADLGPIAGNYLATWTEWVMAGSPAHEPADDNQTCLRVGPLASLSGTLTLPDPEHDGTGIILVAAWRDDGGFNPTEENFLGSLEILYPGECPAGDPCDYVIENLPAGELAWVTARWDADFNGIRTRGDFTASAGPVTIAENGTTVVNLNVTGMYGRDDRSPFFVNCNAMAYNRPGGIQTSLTVEVYDPNGTVPDTIEGVHVTFPGGTMEPITHSGGNVYWRGIDGPPPVGEYTFTVTDIEGRTATSHYYFGGGPNISLPDSTSLQVSEDENDIILSWGGVSDYEGNLFYRARLFGAAGNTLWTSEFTPTTSMQVPDHVVDQVNQEPAPGPTWRVEAFDGETYYSSDHRAATSQVPGSIDNNTPYFDFATVFHRKDSDGDWTQLEVGVSDPNGSVPSTIQSLEVYDSEGTPIHTFQANEYNSFWQMYFVHLPGEPVSGVYRFVVTDNENNSKTTYDYVSSFEIPMVDAATLGASGDFLQPTLHWGAPDNMDRPLYFRVILQDDSGSRVWGSNRIAETSIQVPPGKIHSDGSYKWYIRTTDNPTWIPNRRIHGRVHTVR
jgi:hypothetical protein